MDPADLERLVERKLRTLSPPRAPRALLPRILAAVEREAERPWYARAWRTWPRGWQVASVAALALIAVGVALPGVFMSAQGAPWTFSLPVPSQVFGVARGIETALDAWRIVWRVLVEPVIGYVALFVLVMSAACVAFGTALERVVALGGASKS